MLEADRADVTSARVLLEGFDGQLPKMDTYLTLKQLLPWIPGVAMQPPPGSAAVLRALRQLQAAGLLVSLSQEPARAERSGACAPTSRSERGRRAGVVAPAGAPAAARGAAARGQAVRHARVHARASPGTALGPARRAQGAHGGRRHHPPHGTGEPKVTSAPVLTSTCSDEVSRSCQPPWDATLVVLPVAHTGRSHRPGAARAS